MGASPAANHTGIDQIASALILIEIGDDMARFGAPDRLAAWAALCPVNNESAGKRKSGRIGRGGSVIRYIMCECANSAWPTESSLAAKYKSLMVRKTSAKKNAPRWIRQLKLRGQWPGKTPAPAST